MLRAAAVPVRALLWVVTGWLALMLVLVAVTNHLGWPLLVLAGRVVGERLR